MSKAEITDEWFSTLSSNRKDEMGGGIVKTHFRSVIEGLSDALGVSAEDVNSYPDDLRGGRPGVQVTCRGNTEVDTKQLAEEVEELLTKEVVYSSIGTVSPKSNISSVRAKAMDGHSDVDVYFHRLAPGSPSDEVLHDFYRDNIVICHYENKASLSDDDYDESTDIDTMVEFAKTGGICLIQLDANNQYYDRSRRLGVVPPGTEPFVIGVESDGTRTQRFTDPNEAKPELDDNPDVEYIYKAVQLQENIRVLSSDEFLLTSYEPPSTTFTPWYVVADQIRSILSRESLPMEEPTSYSPDQTERLCEEYLREEYGYYPLIQPGGSSGTNQSFDLIGGIEDERVFGEVKNTKGTSESALNDLEAEASENRRVFYFSRNPVEQSRDGVEITLLSEVIETLQDIDRTDRMMEEMTAR